MVMNAMTPSDLEAFADKYEEEKEEQLMWEKMDAESAAELEKEEHQAKYNPTPTEKTIQYSEPRVIEEEEPVIRWTKPEPTLSEEEEIERMMAETFGADPEEGDFQIALFKQDGDYGWVEFAGIFDSLESVVLYAGKEGQELVVSQEPEEVEFGNSLDFFIVDVASETPEIMFGARLMKSNSLVNLGA